MTNIRYVSSSLTLPRTWGQECKSRPGQWLRLGIEPADTRIHLHQWMLSSERKKKKRKKLNRRKKSIEAAIWQYGKICMKNWTLMVEGPMYYTSWHEAMMELWEKVFCSEEVEKKLLGLSPKRRAGRCLFNQSHFQGNSVNSAQCALCTVWVPSNTSNTCK